MKSRLKDMKTTQYIGLLLMVCAMSILSCTSEIDELPTVETPITFSFSFPEDGKAESRVGKEVFANGDKIYVTAKITTSEEKKCETTVMTYNSGKWTQDGKILTWPQNAVSGSFTAYYLPKTGDSPTQVTNALTESKPECIIRFEDLRNATDDPLMAAKENIQHNGVVNLQFSHMLTRLNATGLKPTTRTVTFRCEEYPLNNRIVFTYDATNGYQHEIKVADDDGGLTMKILQANPNDKDATSTLFFVDMNDATKWKDNLANFKLDQRDKDNKLVIDPPTSLSEGSMYNMQRGRAYTIYFYSGSDNAAFEENESWYTEKEKHPAFKIEEDIKNYFATLTSEGLQEDLDFNNILLTEGFDLFQPTTRGITLKSSFNGNNHTIRNINVANGLFNSIPSGYTIQDLRLENVTITADATECAGALAPINKGKIENVRIEGKNFISSINVPYVGGLVGRNEGTISNVVLSGAFTMDCYAGSITERFCVGGIVGANGNANAGSYSITSTEITAAMLINAAGALNEVDACIGGFAGYNAAAKSIASSSAHVIVNAKDMKAVNCHTGGFIGLNHGKLSSCNASGDVTGGSVNGNGEIRSTTGGFVGFTTSIDIVNSALFASINGCSASGDVFESESNKESLIGGFGGFSEIELLNCSSVGKVTIQSTTNTNRKVGAFIGIISADKTISNSFSMSEPDSGELTFNGNGECITNNCHYLSIKLVKGKPGETPETATANNMNIAGISGYWEWTSSTATYNGAPYLVKK